MSPATTTSSTTCPDGRYRQLSLGRGLLTHILLPPTFLRVNGKGGKVAASVALVAKRDRGRGTFIDSALSETDTFHAEVLATSRRGRPHR